MGMYYKTGNLLEAPVDYICHQVNGLWHRQAN